ncbi:HNH endonuclease [Gimesia alba]|uniref:HNH endonuclease n=1 Tax=Gimesia alba TaxID=2527973 RepID=A0A517RKZ4_9PLAN|nr:HNH endonuclease signature motif containing protein [Gimesia alba]QDT44551.1 HNH endonuclease [Gimesia alba]
MKELTNPQKNTQVGASHIQKILYVALSESKNLASEPDDSLKRLLEKFTFSKESYTQAASAIYREIYYRCTKDLEITPKESTLLEHVVRLLDLDDELIVKLDYEIGLMIYKRVFREAVSDGELTEDEQKLLEKTSRFFDLKKRDINKAISKQALSYYSFLLANSLNDDLLTQDEMTKLAIVANRFGLTQKDLKKLSVPNKKEVLATALGAIKARGEICEGDEEHIRALTKFLNAQDLLKACLMDLELYSRIFEIRKGNLPTLESNGLILQPGEKLHYALSITYQHRVGNKLKKLDGTLYVGSIRLRFIGLHKSHEVKYKNIFDIKFQYQRTPKLSLSVSSGKGGGDYRLQGKVDPGVLFELQEAVMFLIRKSRGLEKKSSQDTRYIPDEIRSEVWYRDGGRCVICNADDYLEFDHIIPLSKGGSTSTENLQILCRKCNSEKSDFI